MRRKSSPLLIDLPLVTIIIPSRNEEKFIGKCLDSIIANDFPNDRLEVFVVDGISQDETREIVESYVRQYAFIKLLDNPRKNIPVAMNIGIKNASGNIIMKMDAHSVYEKDYISKCVRFLIEHHADNVGGILKIMPGENTLIAKTVALVLSHPFGSGNASIKIGKKVPQFADTVAFGCYRKEIFQKIGLFNENLMGSSDIDLNIRLRKAGGRILLFPEIVVAYYADPNLRALWKHNFADGVWATYVLKFGSKAWSWRHWVPLVFVSGLISSMAISTVFPDFLWLLFVIISAYTLANFCASLYISIREKNFQYLITLPIAFGTRHLAHGLGALFGLLLVIMPGKYWKGRRSKA